MKNSPLRVLFVCTANICRSAYADVRSSELLATPDTPGRLDVSSAGTMGFDAAPIDPPMAEQLWSRGVDPSWFRSRRLNADMLDDAHLILTATALHRSFILDERPTAFRRTFTLGQFAEGIGRVDAGLQGEALIEAVRGARVPARHGSDVADPYGRGDAAAAACAQQIDELLDIVIPRLL